MHGKKSSLGAVDWPHTGCKPVGMCQQYEGFGLYLMSLTHTLTVSLKCYSYTFVTEITAWEFLLRSFGLFSVPTI